MRFVFQRCEGCFKVIFCPLLLRTTYCRLSAAWRYPSAWFLLLLTLVLVQPVAAQQEATQWYFGDRAALRFDSITNQPRALTTSVMVAPEGCSSRADAQGNLVLYTNGETVWNRQHQVLANGTGLGLAGV